MFSVRAQPSVVKQAFVLVNASTFVLHKDGIIFVAWH